MNFNLYIARKLKLSNDKRSNAILNIAKYGIALAIIIMILSLSIINGFKNEIESKIYHLNSHIRVQLSPDYHNHTSRPIDYDLIKDELTEFKFISSKYKVIEKQSILKTENNYKALNFRGYDLDKDTTFLSETLISGRMPSFETDINNEIIISKRVQEELGIELNESVFSYFVSDKVKVRKLKVVGIFKTDFQDFDNNIVIGNISMLQTLNGWSQTECSYIGVDTHTKKNAKDDSFLIYDALFKNIINNKCQDSFLIYNIQDEYNTYFAWLDLLDTNILIILVLMSFVSGFTLIAGMLILIFDRIYTIGILKSIGVSNTSIRQIFILLTQKLIFNAMITGNSIAIALCMIQDYFHILKLNPDSYYMSFVPIYIDIPEIIFLNMAVLFFSITTLIFPSYIISKLSPNIILSFD